MILLTAIIHREDTPDILNGLLELGFEGITITKVISKKNIDIAEKNKIEMVVSSTDERELIIDCLRETCSNYGAGSGKVWWVPVSGVERIRTGERDDRALKKLKPTCSNQDLNKVILNTFFSHDDTPNS